MIRLLHGDCRAVLAEMPADSFGAVVTAPHPRVPVAVRVGLAVFARVRLQPVAHPHGLPQGALANTVDGVGQVGIGWRHHGASLKPCPAGRCRGSFTTENLLCSGITSPRVCVGPKRAFQVDLVPLVPPLVPPLETA